MKYYKITNDEEKHYDQQYHDGKNICCQSWNPSGNCAPGGMYFAREDIFAFLDYGPWIREVKLLPDSRVYENPGKPKKWKTDKFHLGPRRKIDVQVIKELLDEGADPKAGNSYALRNWAAKYGHTDCVRLLIPVSNPKYFNSQALRWAAENGHTDCVRLLIPVSDPKAYDSYALRRAAENGHTECVRLLIPVSDPKACYNQALRWAVLCGHTGCVRLLIPVSDPEANNSYELRLATKNGHTDIVKLLKGVKK